MESAALRRKGSRHTLTDQVVGSRYPFVNQVVADGGAGGLLEQMDQMVFAEEKPLTEAVQRDRLCQGMVQVADNLVHCPALDSGGSGAA